MAVNVVDARKLIKHVFVLMLENRSFDHMFGASGLPNIKGAALGASNSYQGVNYPFKIGAPETMPTDPGHEFSDTMTQLCGEAAQKTYKKGDSYPDINNSGFVTNYAETTSEGAKPALDDIAKVMWAVDTKNQVPSLYALASNYVVCDAWHSSLPGPTWPNRYFVHGASSSGLEHSPSAAEMTEWEGINGFSYANGSIFDRLGRGNYRLYQDESGVVCGHLPQVASLKGINFTDVHSLGAFADDLQHNYSWQYTFIEPAYGNIVDGSYGGGSSQHPRDGLQAGNDLISRVYAAIRNSVVWQSSMFIILYDEHGGFYDSVVPKVAVPPDDGADGHLNESGFDFRRYGLRVPAVVVSPWVAKGIVDHNLYDHSSIPATLERLLGLDPLTHRDRVANDVLSLVTGELRNDCPLGV